MFSISSVPQSSDQFIRRISVVSNVIKISESSPNSRQISAMPICVCVCGGGGGGGGVLSVVRCGVDSFANSIYSF